MKYHSPILLLCLSVISGTTFAASAKGDVSWADLRQLGLPVSGLVKQVNVSAGQVVEKGTVLLTLDCEYIQAQAKESTVLAEGLKPGLDRAEKDRDLANELFERTVLSEVEHQEAQHKFIEIKSRYEAALARQAQSLWRKKHCALTATEKVIVLSVKISAGEMINLNTTDPDLVAVASAEKMSVAINVKPPYKQSLSIGKEISVNIANKQYRGRIAVINYAAAGTETTGSQVIILVDAFNPEWIGAEAATVDY